MNCCSNNRHGIELIAALLILIYLGPKANAKGEIPTPIAYAISLSLDGEHRYTGGRYTDHVFHYRLFLPRPYEKAKEYPLILWLHGAGSERGTDNWSQLRYLGTRVYDQGEEGVYPFFLLAPQCPHDNRDGTWFGQNLTEPPRDDNQDQGDELLTVAMEVLDRTIRDYSIDEDRLYLIGISSGGNAAWEAAIRYPNRFAAVAPIASAGGNLDGAKALARNHIWAFHVRADSGTPVAGVRQTVDTIQALGGSCYLTETAGETHDCWTPALIDFRLVDWLLKQRREEAGPTPQTWRPANEFWLAIEAGVLYCLPVPVIGILWCCLWRMKVRSLRESKVEA